MSKIKQKNQFIKPKFCFLCGTELEFVNNSWMQCKSNDCGGIKN